MASFVNFHTLCDDSCGVSTIANDNADVASVYHFAEIPNSTIWIEQAGNDHSVFFPNSAVPLQPTQVCVSSVMCYF